MTTCFHSCTKCGAKFMFKKQLEQHINREHIVRTPTIPNINRASAFMSSILGTHSYIFTADEIQRLQVEDSNQAGVYITHSW